MYFNIKAITLYLVMLISVVSVAAVPCSADDDLNPPPVPAPIVEPKIVLPLEPNQVPVPIPHPNGPQIVSQLTYGKLYIIQGSGEIFFRQVTKEIATIVDMRADLPDDLKTSPIVVNGVFADGNGSPETRIFRGAFLYRVDPLAIGTTNLVIVPSGATDADIVVQPLTVAGTGPNPPPDPVPPIPPDPPTPIAKHLRLSIIFDHQNTTPEIAILMNALVGWNSFFDAGSEYRKYDITTPEPEGIKAIEQLNAAAPGIVVTNKDTGAVIHKGPLPATFADLQTLVGRLTGA